MTQVSTRSGNQPERTCVSCLQSVKPLVHALLVSGCIPTVSLTNNKRIRQKGWKLIAVFVRKASVYSPCNIPASSSRFTVCRPSSFATSTCRRTTSTRKPSNGLYSLWCHLLSHHHRQAQTHHRLLSSISNRPNRRMSAPRRKTPVRARVTSKTTRVTSVNSMTRKTGEKWNHFLKSLLFSKKKRRRPKLVQSCLSDSRIVA